MNASTPRYLFHYFFNEVPGKTFVSQIDATHICLPFSTDSLMGESVSTIEFDHRRRGVLVGFDGTLLWGSLPKRHQALLCHKKLFDLQVPVESVCMVNPEEEVPAYSLGYNRWGVCVAIIPIFRSIMLLPYNFRMVVRKYNEKSLHPKYLIITTDQKSASWLTTSW